MTGEGRRGNLTAVAQLDNFFDCPDRRNGGEHQAGRGEHIGGINGNSGEVHEVSPFPE